MLTRRTFFYGAASGLAASQLPFGRSASAQVISQTAKVIVPFPAGGSTDALARIMADKLKGGYAPATIVENRVGAAGRLAVEYVKNAEADGSVMLFTPDFLMTVYPHSFRSLNYDPVRDFTPVATVAKSALCINVGPAVPAEVRTLSDFVQWCKANPKTATYATTAAGGTPHFAGLMLSQASKVDMTPVHYKGGAPALQDVIGGHVSSSVNPVSEALPFVTSGKIRTLAVTSDKRSSFLPDVPTMKEAGYDVVIEAWLGTLVPSKTPPEIVSKLNLAIKEAFAAPDVVQKLAAIGNEADYKTPAQFAETVKADIERWGPVVKASGFVAD
jgi:tripartite-type tricarboxylate transporter receptor subunit TctC